MNCSTCSSRMLLLFTNYVCDTCNPPRQAGSTPTVPSTGEVVVPDRDKDYRPRVGDIVWANRWGRQTWFFTNAEQAEQAGWLSENTRAAGRLTPHRVTGIGKQVSSHRHWCWRGRAEPLTPDQE